MLKKVIGATESNIELAKNSFCKTELSRKGKHQYSILTHIYGIQKDGNDNPICKTARDTDVQNSLLDSVGE